MYLKELIAALEKADQIKVVPMGFHNPHSYRGTYSELAFEPKENATVAEMLASAKSALGSTYEGWKGGEYTMTEYADCHLAWEGSTGEEIGRIFLDYMLGNLRTE